MIGRKEFAAIAAVIAAWRSAGANSGEADILASDMAEALAKLNSRFNRDKFMAACRKPPYG